MSNLSSWLRRSDMNGRKIWFYFFSISGLFLVTPVGMLALFILYKEDGEHWKEAAEKLEFMAAPAWITALVCLAFIFVAGDEGLEHFLFSPEMVIVGATVTLESLLRLRSVHVRARHQAIIRAVLVFAGSVLLGMSSVAILLGVGHELDHGGLPSVWSVDLVWAGGFAFAGCGRFFETSLRKFQSSTLLSQAMVLQCEPCLTAAVIDS